MALPRTESNEALHVQATWTATGELLGRMNENHAVVESLLARINKMQTKLAAVEHGVGARKAVAKLAELYAEAMEKNAQEQAFIGQCMEQVMSMIALKEAVEQNDSKRRKAKPQTLTAPPRRTRGESGRSPSGTVLLHGQTVAVKHSKEDYWLLAFVVQYLPEDDRYEVEDAEDDEDRPGVRKRYVLPASKVIELRDDHSPETEYPAGSSVFAIYPMSSCFYRATVAVPPSKSKDHNYIVQFVDDDDFEREVPPGRVFRVPNPK